MVGVNIPVTPVRRQIAFTQPLPELPATSPSLTIDFPSNFYFHPEGKGLLLGWSDPNEPEGFNVKFELEDWLLGLGAIAETRAPAVLDSGISGGWAGLYEITPTVTRSSIAAPRSTACSSPPVTRATAS